MAGKSNGSPAEPGASIKLQLSVGASHSKSTSELVQNQVRGSSLTAGDNLTMVASGSHGQSGDLSVIGSGVTGNKVTLAAKNDLLLAAATLWLLTLGAWSARHWRWYGQPRVDGRPG